MTDLLLFHANTISIHNVQGRCHNLRNVKEASEVTEANPAGCAGEGKQSKGN